MADPSLTLPPESPYALTQARASAIFEIVLCSGVPSQLALAYMLALAGLTPFGSDGQLSFGYITTLLMLDATVLIGLIFWFLGRHGERPREVFLDRRPVAHEILLGIPTAPLVFLIG